MSFSLYDPSTREFLGDVASIGGWSDWIDWLDQETIATPAARDIANFLDDGGTTRPDRLAQALRQLNPPSHALESITQTLLRACERASVIALSDGTEDSLDEMRTAAGFKEDQDRDERGRWTDDDNPSTERPTPIHVETVGEAIELILAGKVVELKNPKQVNTVLRKLAKIARQAEKHGEKAPNYDLCNVSVKGTNIFCGQSLKTKEHPNGLPRITMPQFSGTPVKGSDAADLPRDKKGRVDIAPEFLDYLEKRGIDVGRSELVPSARLKASQAELVGPKVAELLRKGAPQKGPIFISRDDYVIDGHHHWAANVAKDAKDNRLGNSSIRAIRVDAPISEVLKIARSYTTSRIKPVAGPGVKKAAAGFDPDQPRDDQGQWSEGDAADVAAAQTRVVLDEVASALDFPVDRIIVSDTTPREFKVGQYTFTEAGHFDPKDGQITLNADSLKNASHVETMAMAVHEVQHAQFDVVRKAAGEESVRLRELIQDDTKFKEFFKASGYARSEKVAELDKMFPAHAAMKVWGSAYHEPVLHEEIGGSGGLVIKTTRDKMEAEDGVSAYSRAYWEAAGSGGSFDHALNETLAEVARIDLVPRASRSGDTKPSEAWTQFARDIRIAYRTLKKQGKVT